MSATQSQPPDTPSSFNPLFTLISTTSASTPTGSSSTEYHHPTVHYIFSDDPDPHDPITTAALHSLNPPRPPSSAHHKSQRSSSSHPKKRYLILDLDASGTKITNASSMSPEWAITSARLEKAPSWEGEEAEEEGKKRMMLRIEGCEVGGSARLGEKEEMMGVEELMARFEKGMGELRRVVDMGGKGV
ncbi:MAG: hypothetical protein LQ337_005877 [Flavoplaca oasis]|nr:MAG: hypothetical protein LQ337_005877 [Flavoplaca oasis]